MKFLSRRHILSPSFFFFPHTFFDSRRRLLAIPEHFCFACRKFVFSSFLPLSVGPSDRLPFYFLHAWYREWLIKPTPAPFFCSSPASPFFASQLPLPARQGESSLLILTTILPIRTLEGLCPQCPTTTRYSFLILSR